MNIPKFRAWFEFKKCVVEVESIDFVEETIKGSGYSEIPFSEVILMQSTGLHDKNETLIFEGDIVRVEQDGVYKLHTVYWGGDYPAFEFKPDLGCECNGFSYAIAENLNMEVVGSIHTKELVND